MWRWSFPAEVAAFCSSWLVVTFPSASCFMEHPFLFKHPVAFVGDCGLFSLWLLATALWQRLAKSTWCGEVWSCEMPISSCTTCRDEEGGEREEGGLRWGWWCWGWWWWWWWWWWCWMRAEGLADCITCCEKAKVRKWEHKKIGMYIF